MPACLVLTEATMDCVGVSETVRNHWRQQRRQVPVDIVLATGRSHPRKGSVWKSQRISNEVFSCGHFTFVLFTRRVQHVAPRTTKHRRSAYRTFIIGGDGFDYHVLVSASWVLLDLYQVQCDAPNHIATSTGRGQVMW